MKNKRLNTLIALKSISWLLLAVGFVALSMYSFSYRDDKKCEEAVVLFKNDNNLGFVSQEDIFKSINRVDNQWRGEKIKNLKLQLIENELKTNEYIEKVDIFIDNQEKMCVQVRPKKPIFRVNLPSSSHYITEDWSAMPTSTKFSRRNIVISGNVKGLIEPRTKRDSFIRQEIKSLKKYIDKNKIWDKLIDQIVVQNSGKIELVMTFTHGICKIGYVDKNLDKKMKRIEYFFKYAPKYADISIYKSFDFQYNNQVITKKTQN